MYDVVTPTAKGIEPYLRKKAEETGKSFRDLFDEHFAKIIANLKTQIENIIKEHKDPSIPYELKQYIYQRFVETDNALNFIYRLQGEMKEKLFKQNDTYLKY